MELKM